MNNLQQRIIDRLKSSGIKPLRLSKRFINKYISIKPPFGFNGLGEIVYLRTYSRPKEDGTKERWFETVERVVNGTYTLQKRWVLERGLPWDEHKAHRSAQEMYDRIFNMKFLPPGRGLWAMGSPITEERGLFASLNNCSYVSTENLKEDFSKPFAFLMDMSMLGVGVGFDTKGTGQLIIVGPDKDRQPEFYDICDTREEWVKSVSILIDSYFKGTPELNFGYSKIRKAGEPIKGFGGVSSGSKPLEELHKSIRTILDGEVGNQISATTIVDLQNLIGKCVVSGNVRRTAEIAFGDADSDEYLDLKNYKVNPHREIFGWTSNNSVFAELGRDYSKISERIKLNGEPGFAWLGNMQDYGRLCEPKNGKDHRAKGGNPCIIGDTLIAVADGRNAVKIKDLVGTKYPVYTIDNKKVRIEIAENTWKTRENAEIYKLELDNGSYMLSTKDHKVMLRNGLYKELINLKHGDSLMPFNSYVSNKNYRQISSNDGRDRRQYRMIAEYNNLIVNSKTTAIHHKNFDSFDDTIENLEAMSHKNHINLHRKKMIGTKNPMKRREVVLKMLESRDVNGKLNPMFGKNHNEESIRKIGIKSKENWLKNRVNMIQSIRIGMNKPYVKKHLSHMKNLRTIFLDWSCPVCGFTEKRTKFQTENSITCSKACSNIYRSKNFNHKVKSVSFYGFEDVYDILVKNTHNFAIISSHEDKRFITSSGIFIHNCLEQTLESYELCCLVENFPHRHKTKEDFLRTLKFSYLYAKTVTLAETHWAETNRVMLRNRRIGCSVSGIAQFLTDRGIGELKDWLTEGYDMIQKYDALYSEWMCIPKSIKTTSVKPSGSVSLLAGSTPGVHFPISEYYIRRIRLGVNSELVGPLKKAGYKVEPAFGNEKTTCVVEIPVHAGEGIRNEDDVSMWEQLSLASFMQRYWADNQVSATITFDPKTEGNHISHALNYFQWTLKGVSFLPRNKGAYRQMPYESLTKKDYKRMLSKIKGINFSSVKKEVVKQEMFCDGQTCELEDTPRSESLSV